VCITVEEEDPEEKVPVSKIKAEHFNQKFVLIILPFMKDLTQRVRVSAQFCEHESSLS